MPPAERNPEIAQEIDVLKTSFAAALAAVLMSTTAHAQIANGVLKIGVLDDQSGVYADFGGKWSVEAAKMAVEDFGGKVLGSPIEVLSADHQNKPDLASTIARQWYDVDHVDMITELTNSAVGLAVQALSAEKHKITMNTGAASTALTGSACEPYGFHWAYDTHALAAGTGGYMTKQGGNTWFFITADYAFGTALQADTTAAVEAEGAKVVGLANAGLDTTNAMKQASEFGLTQNGTKLAALLFTTAEVHGLGLK